MKDGAVLRKLRSDKQMSQAQLAELAGTSQQQIDKLERGLRKFSLEWARKLAPHLGVKIKDLWSGEGGQVPVVGYVGAGETVHYYDDHPQGSGLDEVDAPPGLRNGVALKVKGDSMAPRYFSGEIIFFSRSRGLDPLNCIGKDCVVHLQDGRYLLKRVEKGTEKGTYTLRS